MSQPPYESDFDNDPRVSPRLAEDLSDLFGSAPRVSGAVDERILSSARAHLARRGSSRWRLTPRRAADVCTGANTAV